MDRRGLGFATILLLSGCARVQHVDGGRLSDAYDPATALDRHVRTCEIDPGRCPRADRLRLDLERGFLAHAAGDRDAAYARLSALLDVEPFWTPTADPETVARRAYAVAPEPYRPLVTETLAGLGWAMLAAAERGDDAAAARAAVRFSELRERLYDARDRSEHGAFASYVAGQIFERMGRRPVARAYFREVLATRESLLARAALARTEDAQDPVANAYLAMPRPTSTGTDVGYSRIVVVVGVGHVPPLRPERLPVAFARTLAGPYIDALGIADRVDELEAMGVSEVVVPDLAPVQRSKDTPVLWVDDHRIRLERLSDLAAELEAEARGLRRLSAAAALLRAVQGQDPTFLRAPDTRSVTTLPAQVYAAELDLPPGLHQVRAEVASSSGSRRAATAVRTADRDVAVVGLTVL